MGKAQCQHANASSFAGPTEDGSSFAEEDPPGLLPAFRLNTGTHAVTTEGGLAPFVDFGHLPAPDVCGKEFRLPSALSSTSMPVFSKCVCGSNE